MKVTKQGTDRDGVSRHKHRDMPRKPIDLDWYLCARAAAGYATDTDVAAELNMTRQMFHKILKGGRLLKEAEANDLATLLHVSPRELFNAFGIKSKALGKQKLRISGLVQDDGEIVQTETLAVDLGPDDYPESAQWFKGELFYVESDINWPRFKQGDLVGLGPRSVEFERFLDHEVVAKLRDGRRFLRILHQGDRPGAYFLTPLVKDEKPMLTTDIEWVAFIEVTIHHY